MKPDTGSTTVVTFDHKPILGVRAGASPLVRLSRADRAPASRLERLGLLSFGFGTNDTNLAAAGLLGHDPSTDKVHAAALAAPGGFPARRDIAARNLK